MSHLENKWWFQGLSAFVSVLCVLPLLRAAGIGTPDNLAQWIVAGLCFFCMSRAFAFLAWLVLLLGWPSSPLLERTAGKGARPPRP